MKGPLLLRIAGVALWIFSGVPAIPELWQRPAAGEGSHGLGPAGITFWISAFLLFGALFWLSSRAVGGERSHGSPAVLLLLQSSAALSMFYLICTGFESVLLIVVAAEVGFILSLRSGIAWVFGQSLVMGAIATADWSSVVQAWEWTAATFGFEIFAFFTAHLGASESRAKLELLRTNAELRATQELLDSSIRIAERIRISRELHDLLGHHLTALSLNLEVASHLVKGEALEPVEKAKAVTKLLLADVREAVSALRRGDSVDLAPALRALAAGVSRPRVHLDLPESVHIADPESAQALLRCTQEVITNAVKHANAANLWIALAPSFDGGVVLKAKDDGRGASLVTPGNGLMGMRERLEAIGGRLSIESEAERGFSVEAFLPAPSTGGSTL